MEIDINFALVGYSTNVNIMGYHWRAFQTAFWFDRRLETFHQAWGRAKEIVWDEIYTNHPQLKGTDFLYTESGEMPIIQVDKHNYREVSLEEKKSVLWDFNESKLMQAVNKLPTLEEQIKSCTSLKVLESYKFIVKGKPELEKAYDFKRYELNANNLDKAYPIKLETKNK